MMSVHVVSAPSAALDFPLGKAERPGVGYRLRSADRHGSSAAITPLPPTPPLSIGRNEMLLFGLLLAGTGLGTSTRVAAAELGRHAQPRDRPKRAFANLPPSVSAEDSLRKIAAESPFSAIPRTAWRTVAHCVERKAPGLVCLVFFTR